MPSSMDGDQAALRKNERRGDKWDGCSERYREKSRGGHSKSHRGQRERRSSGSPCPCPCSKARCSKACGEKGSRQASRLCICSSETSGEESTSKTSSKTKACRKNCR